jgi:hypothetical protein
MSSSWVPLTGSKGLTPAPLAVPSQSVRRWCSPWNAAPSALVAGFAYNYQWWNYYTHVTATQAHQQLNGNRTAQGLVTFSGLAVMGTPDHNYIFTPPWDMLPNPMSNRICSVVNVNNQRGRFDLYWDTSYGWIYTYDSSGVALSSGVFVGIQFSFQTYVPSSWVDFGMKSAAIQAPVLPGKDTAIDYTVGPGQISGYLAGKPYTVQFTAVTTVRLQYQPIPGTSPVVFFYYDVPNQRFNHTIVPVLVGQTTPSADFDPTVWMRMAETGQVVLATHVLDYTTNNYVPANLMDHRYLMRGPLDTNLVAVS